MAEWISQGDCINTDESGNRLLLIGGKSPSSQNSICFACRRSAVPSPASPGSLKPWKQVTDSVDNTELAGTVFWLPVLLCKFCELFKEQTKKIRFQMAADQLVSSALSECHKLMNILIYLRWHNWALSAMHCLMEIRILKKSLKMHHRSALPCYGCQVNMSMSHMLGELNKNINLQVLHVS